MVHTPEGEEQLQNWNEIVHLSLLFLEAIAFEPVIFTTDFFSCSSFSFKILCFWPACPIQKGSLDTLQSSFQDTECNFYLCKDVGTETGMKDKPRNTILLTLSNIICSENGLDM